MSYNKFLDACGKYAEMRHQNDLPKQKIEKIFAIVRDQWIDEKRYAELIAFILENWDSGNGDYFSRSFGLHLVKNKETGYYKQLWKGIIRNRLEKLWNRFDRLKQIKPNYTPDDLKRVDLRSYDEFAPGGTVQQDVAFKRWFTLEGISEFISGLEALGEKEEIERQKALYEVVENMERPKPGRTTDRRKIDDELFWQLISESRNRGSDKFKFIDNLKITLEAFHPREVRNFHRILLSKANELNSWEHWALAYIIRRGCGDDEFDYFKSWVISRGHQTFVAVRDLDASQLPFLFDEDPQLEELYYLSQEVYERKTTDLMKPVKVRSQKLKGRKWNEDKLAVEFPVFCKMFDYS